MSSVNQTSALLERPSLAQTVADLLRREIIAGTIAPASLIAEVVTAERLGVSRVPVREAVLLLEREGLLVLEGRSRRRWQSYIDAVRVAEQQRESLDGPMPLMHWHSRVER